MNCSPGHRLASQILLFGLAVWVSLAGLAYPIHRPRTVWPWTRGWFMFYRSQPRESRIRAAGAYEDGSRGDLDLGRWFRRKASPRTRRSDEMFRHTVPLTALADFLCAAHNREAPPGHRLAAVSIEEVFWENPRGRRLELSEVPSAGLQAKTWVRDRNCAP